MGSGCITDGMFAITIKPFFYVLINQRPCRPHNLAAGTESIESRPGISSTIGDCKGVERFYTETEPET